MKWISILVLSILPGLLIGCGGTAEIVQSEDEAPGGVRLEVEPPPPLEVPELKEVASETDWEAKAHNKEIEVVQILNTINPVAAYITEAFKQYGDRFSPTLDEEWSDTQAQLQKALNLYESCKERKAEGNFSKKLFLDLEEVWQLLVKTGVAGLRTKSMVDSELQKITATA
jgi:hypothetical protein